MDIRSLLSFLPRSRCKALAAQNEIPEYQTGVCLFADISGFTFLGEALRQSLGVQQGAEELAATINRLVGNLAESVFRYGGDILNFNGDAITCWYPDDSSSPQAALASALEMQAFMDQHGCARTRDGLEYTLTIKIGLAYGSTHRMVVGDPHFHLFDFLCGHPLVSMASAQHMAEKGQIILDPALSELVRDRAILEAAGGGFSLLTALKRRPEIPTRPLMPENLAFSEVQAFFPPAVYQLLSNAVDRFVAELRSVITGFVSFEGLDYDNDPHVKVKLNQYLAIVQLLADFYGGSLVYLDAGDKGSVLMVLFGAPVAHMEDAERAVRWALALQQAIENHAFITSQRIGLSRGLAYVGPLGGHTRRSYTALGDEVTAASRLMQACQPGQVLVSRQIEKACAQRFIFQKFPGFSLKGKEAPIPVAMPVVEIPAQPQIAALPLIGRSVEEKRLEDRLHGLSAGRGCIVRIQGLEGTGKTALANSFAGKAMARGVRVLYGFSQSLGQRTPYAPWREVLRGLLGIQPTWPAVQQTFQMQNMLGWMLPEKAALLPLLGDLFGFQIPDTPQTAGLPAHERQSALFDLVGSILQKAAANQPVMVLIEDCHWADRASCELFERISRWTETNQLMLAATHRPTSDPQAPITACIMGIARSGRVVEEIILDNLPPDATSALTTRLMGGRIESSLMQLIQARTEGNPLYIEELVQIIRETNVVRSQGDEWVLIPERIHQIHLPETIQGIVLARLDQLDEMSRLSLKVASVLGRSFEIRTVRDIHPAQLDQEGLLSLFNGLQMRNLCEVSAEQDPPTGRFQHSVIQEVAYETLTITQRQELHHAAAVWIETIYQKKLTPHYALLAYHYEKGGYVMQAIDYLLKAGDQARLMYAFREARELYEQALSLLYPQLDVEADRIARTLVRLGLTCQDAFDFKRARAYYEEAFQYWQRAGGAARRSMEDVTNEPLRLDFPYLPLTLDPALAEDVDSMAVVIQLFSGLVEQGPNLELVPSAAQRWETAEDGASYVFHLNPDILWSDGRPLTAHDFVYAWLRVLDPQNQSPVAHMLFDIQGARAYHHGKITDPQEIGIAAPDPYTLHITLERPIGYFLSLLAHTAFLPVPEHRVRELGEAWTEPENLVTNGYFTLQSWEQNSELEGRLVLQSSPIFHGCFDGNVRFVELHAIADPQERAQAYLGGKLDVLSMRDMGSQRPHLRERFGGEYFSAPILAVSYLGFNLHRPPFDQPAVRRAFAMAVDTEQYANVSQEGFSFPGTGGFVPPGMPGHTPDIALPFNPEAARALLEEAGYPSSAAFPEVELICNPGAEDQLEFLAVQWQANLGITVKTTCLSWERFDQRLKSDLPEMFIELFAADFADPDNFLASGPQQIWVAWREPEYKIMIENARRAVNQDERLDLYRQADYLLIESAVLMPIKYLRSHWLFKPRVKSFPLSSLQRSHWKDVQLDG